MSVCQCSCAASGCTKPVPFADYAYYPGIDQPFAATFGQTGATSTRYFDQDELGNVLGHFKSTATRFGVTQRNTYSTWGVPTINVDASSRVLWKGLMWEGDIVGMYFVRNRWYDPDVGRFVREEPLRLDLLSKATELQRFITV